MAFLTCEPNAIVRPVHPKAMPVMLSPADFNTWLKDDHASACALARPFSDEQMRVLV
jgi:putative SOS response-associated peptidase YedK